MFVRPAGSSQSRAVALRRLQSSSLLAHLPRAPLLSPFSPSASATVTSPLASSRPLGVDRRLLSSSSSSSPSRPGLQSWRTHSSTPSAARPLATAVGDFSPADSIDPTISTVSSSTAEPATASRLTRLYAASPAPTPLWELRPHNVSSPLVISEEPEEPTKRHRISNRGIPGDTEEMLSVLDACLEVGKLDRAALVLKRLAHPQFASADIDVGELQSRYLRVAVVDVLMETATSTAAERLHKWFELEMCGGSYRSAADISPENIALMLKATLLTSRGARRNRLIDRYMSMAPGDAGLEVLYMTGILNDQDRATITSVCRTYNFGPTPDSTAENSTLFEQALRNIEDPSSSAVGEAAASTENPSDDIVNSLLGVGDTPEVLGTPQKGAGLRTLKKTLSLFGEIPNGRDIASLGAAERRQIQARLERDCIDAAVDRWSDENESLLKMGLNTSLSTASLNARLYEWHRDLQMRITQELKKIEQAEASESRNKDDFDRCMYGPFLRQSSPSRLAAVTIVSTLSALAMQGADKGLAISSAITQIAKVAEEDIRLIQQTEELRRERQRLAQSLGKGKGATSKSLSKVPAVKTAKKLARTKALRTGKSITLPTQGEAAELEAVRLSEAVAAANAAAHPDLQVTEAVEEKQLSRGQFEELPALELATETATATAMPAEADQELESAKPKTKMPDAWPVSIRARVGAVLVSMLMETARVTVVRQDPETGTLLSDSQAAFSRINQLKRGKKVGMLTANPAIIDMLKREPRGDFLARHLPMVVEPDPWQGFDKGGFLESPAPLIRVKDSRKDQKIYAEAAIARGDMDQVLKGLDVLGRTAWRVNRPIFDVMLEAWNAGDDIAEIPPIDPQIPTPPEPKKNDDPMKRRSWMKAVKAAENERSGMHSVRCFMNFQMEIARAFRDQTFYFPHNVDFRGRAYPIPPYFNHMGADHVRGLLVFAKGKVLGEDGLRWLKVHLANVYGYDKASLSERAAFSENNLEHIRDSARQPLAGQRWWLAAEDPWQCLAACMELTAAYDLEDPTQYESHLPVHQDGTCNGLQHYAALGGDSWGAKQVNLEPGDRPADVYSAVADIVKDAITEDAAKGNATAQALVGKIKRKVVKQTVMTNVYGVTFSGARKQVLKQLDALYPKLEAQTGISGMLMASYIATHIFKALSTMFSGAHDIQNWLGEIGGRVCRTLTPDQIERIVSGEPAAGSSGSSGTTGKAGKTPRTTKASEVNLLNQFRSTLVWTTPLKMPVVQPYRNAESRTIETCLQDLVLSVPARNDPVNKRKQLQAFPPNFIHSLDASHMLLSALECDALGLQFAAVHDSFWTHASDVATMNRVLRDAFVRIHSEDVVGRLAAEFEARYKGSLYLAQISRGSPAAKKILALRKEKRLSLKDELVQEWQRMQMLQSGDSKQVSKAQRMVTPTSIYLKATEGSEGATAADDMIVAEDMSEFGLGSIPEGEKEAADLLAAKAAKKAKTTKKSASKKKGAADQATADLLEAELEMSMAEDVDGDDMDDGLGMGADADADGDGDLDADAGADAADYNDEPPKMNAHDAALAGTGHFEAKLRDLKKYVARPNRHVVPVQVWVPLTFPAIPAKGDFDVARLKDSDYFFS